MSKSYNTDVVKFASKIRKRNQGMIDDYAKAQQKQALIGSIGNALTGVVGAYGQYKQQQQQQAASQQIGAMPELGLSSDVSSQIAPNQLLSAALAIRARNQAQPLTALQQAELERLQYEAGRRPTMEQNETAMFNAKLEAERAQMEANKALAADRLREPPRIPVKIGADGKPVLTEGSYAVDPADALRLATGGGGSGYLSPEDRQAKNSAYRALYKEVTGKDLSPNEDFAALDDQTITAGLNQVAVSGRQDTALDARKKAAAITASMMDSKSRRDALVRLNIARSQLLQSQGDNVTKLIGNQISAAQMSAGSPGRTLEDFATNARNVAGGVDIAEIDAMIEALQNAESSSALPGAGGAMGSVKPIEQRHIDAYNAASPEEKARMKQEAAAAGLDVSGLK